MTEQIKIKTRRPLTTWLHAGFRWTIVFSAAAGLAGALLLLAFYYYAYAVLGYGPMYNHPDPKTLAISVYYMPVINVLLTAWILSIPFWLLASVLAFCYKTSDRERVWKYVFVSFAAQLFCFVIWSVQFDWYMD
jgi:hypothetical protein